MAAEPKPTGGIVDILPGLEMPWDSVGGAGDKNVWKSILSLLLLSLLPIMPEIMMTF